MQSEFGKQSLILSSLPSEYRQSRHYRRRPSAKRASSKPGFKNSPEWRHGRQQILVRQPSHIPGGKPHSEIVAAS